MRIASLLVLAFLLPVFAYAALININTADATLLDTLPGIGPSKAAAIITYRNEHGPFVKIEDIQNVSGIGPSTYADIKSLITVGETALPESSSPVATTTTITNSGGAPPEYIPIPTLRIITSGDRTVSSGADTAFTAVVYDSRGNKRDDALILWSFGDGMQRTGASVYHSYYHSGEYIVVVHVSTPDDGVALVESIVTVKDASVKIVSISARGISLANNSSRELDLSLWRLSAGGKEFKIPVGTQILASRTILFPSQIIQLPIAGSASLLYPSGEVAATFPASMKDLGGLSLMQPSPSVASYEKVQEVEQITSTKTYIQTNEEGVRAPAAATDLAAAGAALPATPEKSGSIFSSPWFFGLIGVIALAGAAFIFI